MSTNRKPLKTLLARVKRLVREQTGRKPVDVWVCGFHDATGERTLGLSGISVSEGALRFLDKHGATRVVLAYLTDVETPFANGAVVVVDRKEIA